jgi:hypothetical protein
LVVTRLCLLILLIRIVWRWKINMKHWWNEETEILKRKTGLNGTLYTTNLTQTGPGLNLGFWGKRPANNHLGYGMATSNIHAYATVLFSTTDLAVNTQKYKTETIHMITTAVKAVC